MPIKAATLVKNARIFSGAVAGLTLAFARNTITVDELGNQVAVNSPRFGRTTAIAGALGPSQNVLTGMGGSPYVAAGLNYDGKALVMAMENSASDRRVRVLTETDTSNVWTTQQDFNLGRPTSGGGIGGNSGDIRRKVGTASDDGLCYVPKAFTVLHGTIVAFCEVLFRTGGSGTVWTSAESRGCGFAVSKDYGATWAYEYNDTASNFNAGKSRGSGWSMCGYYAPFQVVGQPFLEAWICACDYQAAGTPPASAPHGGTVYWFKLTRSTPSEAFVPVNASGIITMGRDNIDVTSVNNSLVYSQRQGVFLAKDTSNPDKLIVGIAESDARWSSITKLTNIDRTNYAAGGYTTQKNWHGFRDSSAELSTGHATFTGSMTSGSNVISSITGIAATWANKIAPYNSLAGTVIRIPGAGAAAADLIASVTAFNEGASTITVSSNASTNSPGATCVIQCRGDTCTGNQFVAACPGPADGEVILGGDAAIGTLDLVQANDTLCKHRRLWGGHTDERDPADTTATSGDYNNWGCHRVFIAQIKVDAPEQPNRILVATCNRSTQLSGSAGPIPANINTLLISRDSGRPGTWASVQWPDTSSVFTADSSGLFVVKEFLYVFTASAVKRYAIPGIVAGRPLLVSPGVTNTLRENFGGTFGGYDDTYPNHANFIRCPKVGGKFQRVAIAGDGSGQSAGTALGDLVPQPPIYHDPNDANSGNVYRVRTNVLVNGTSAPTVNDSNQVVNFPICSRGSDAQFVGTIGWGAAFTGYCKFRTFFLNATAQPESVPVARGKSPCNSFIMFRVRPFGGGAVAFTGPTWQQASTDQWDAVTLSRNVTSAWNTNAAGASAMLVSLFQGAGADRAENDFYMAFDQFSQGQGDYGYPQPRAIAGGTADNSQITSIVNPNEVASVSGLALVANNSFTFFAAGAVAKYCWDQFTFRDGSSTEWPILTLYGDANNYATVAPSPWSTTSPSNTINREGRLRTTINTAGTPTAKEQTSATFMQSESLVVAIRFDAATNTVTIDAVIAGQRMATQTHTAAGWAGKTFDTVKFGNNDASVVSSFAWFSIFGENRLMGDTEVSAQLRSLAFASADPSAARDTRHRPD